MAYFPYKQMPVTKKKDAPGASTDAARIMADDFNLHDQELAAMEEWLGVAPYVAAGATNEDEEAFILGAGEGRMLHLVARLSEKINVLIEDGFCSTSGVALVGHKVTFPEAAHATFLKATPATGDKTITVESTLGFPDRGVISILNDSSVGLRSAPCSMVEWIRYEGRSPTEFLNCTRGYLGSTTGRHVGFYKGDSTAVATKSASKKNEADICTTVASQTVCRRRYPGWRHKDVYSVGAFGLSGTFVSVVRSIRVGASGLPLNNDLVVSAAAANGILGTDSEGYVLRSGVEEFRDAGELSWAEAEAYVDSLVENGSAKLVRRGSEWLVPPLSIPVFQGMMGVQYSLAGIGIVPHVSSDKISVLDIIQSSSGQVYVSTFEHSAGVMDSGHMPFSNILMNASVAYSTFFVPSDRTIGERY